MPLALELAAAWVRTLSPEEIAQEIEGGIDFLAAYVRDLPERHRSMRAVFDHSWRLLSADEQSVLARLSVFRGGFQREAAEAIAGASLVVLSALIAKSFVRRAPGGRYELHELVHQYASERLHENLEEEATARDRHRDYFLTWLGQCEIGLTSSRQRETIAEITLDLDNMRLAWERAAEQHQLARLQQVAFPMFWFYELRNLLAEGESTFRQAVQGAPPYDPQEPAGEPAASIARAHLQAFQAHFVHRQSRNAEAVQMLEQSLSVLREGTARAALTDTLWIYGTACWMVGELERASHHFDQALALERELKRAWPLAAGHISIGYLEFERGNYAESERWLRQGLAQSRALGDPTLTAFAIAGLCRVLKRSGQLSETELLLQKAYRLARESGNRLAVGLSLEELAEIAEARGDMIQARRFCRESIALYRQTGDEWGLSRALNRLGALELAANGGTEARQIFLEALGVASRGNFSTNLLDAFYGIAEIEAREGRTILALEYVLRILDDPSASVTSKGITEKLRVQLEARLTQEEIQAAVARVRGEALEDVVQAVLAGG
jgi:predicted ATPase